jgi:hypothetical protein
VTAVADLKLDALPLLSALMQPDVDDVVFVEAAATAVEQRAESQISPVVTPDERGLQWMHLIDELARLHERRPYVGIFRKVVRAAASQASELPSDDHRVAAIVIIDQTTATAESLSEFRDGMLAAESVSSNVLHPRLVVRRLLRTALPYVDDPKARVNVVYALRLTLEILSPATEQSLSLDDLEILSSAIDEMPALHDDLRALGEHAVDLGRLGHEEEEARPARFLQVVEHRAVGRLEDREGPRAPERGERHDPVALEHVGAQPGEQVLVELVARQRLEGHLVVRRDQACEVPRRHDRRIEERRRKRLARLRSAAHELVRLRARQHALRDEHLVERAAQEAVERVQIRLRCPLSATDVLALEHFLKPPGSKSVLRADAGDAVPGHGGEQAIDVPCARSVGRPVRQSAEDEVGPVPILPDGSP